MACAAVSNFHFVPFNGLDDGKVKRESQKYLTAARKHVMRDIGRSRRRKRKPSAASMQIVPAARPQKLAKKSCSPEYGRQQLHEINMPAMLKPSIPAGLSANRLDPFVRLPVKTTERMRFLFDHLLTTNCKTVALMRGVAWPLLTLDPGIFYHTLALSALCLSTRYSGSAEKDAIVAEALEYYGSGLESVNKRLGDKEQRYSDGVVLSITISAIYTISTTGLHAWCWETTHVRSPIPGPSDVDGWAVHLGALRKVLNRRGGISSIESNGALRHWLYLMDLEGAIPRDVPPFFPLPSLVSTNVDKFKAERKPTVAACLRVWKDEFPAHRGIIDVFADLDTAISHVSHCVAQDELYLKHGNERGGKGIDSNLLLPLAHRCLRLQSDHPFEAALRHAILIFHALARRSWGPPAAGMGIHVIELISALKQCLERNAARMLPKLIMWMLVVGAMEAHHLGWDANWFFAQIVDGLAVDPAKEPEEIETAVRHAMAEMVWLDAALSPPLALMTLQLREFVEAQKGAGGVQHNPLYGLGL